MFENNEVIEFHERRWNDGDVTDLVGQKVVLKHVFVYGVVEAVRLGSKPGIKIANEWYTGNDISYIVVNPG